jgi:hypothetical protein
MMAAPNRYGPAPFHDESSIIVNMSELWMRMCCSSTPTDEGEYHGNPGDADATEKPSVIIPPSSLSCVGFVSNRADVASSYRKKFAKRMINMRRNRHGVVVAKATQSELITFEELLRKLIFI